jgi:hypothetical protein
MLRRIPLSAAGATVALGATLVFVLTLVATGVAAPPTTPLSGAIFTTDA